MANDNGNGKAPVTNAEVGVPPGFMRSNAMNGAADTILNVLSTRALNILSKGLDPRRNLDKECGYPDTMGVGPDDYRELYDREPMAARVATLMPKECWQVTPDVFEDESSKHVTDFEEDWDSLARQLQPHQSWHDDEDGSIVWSYLRRADELCGIGHFGIILLGIDDGKAMNVPADGVSSLTPQELKDPTKPKESGPNGKATTNRRIDLSQLSIPTDSPAEPDKIVANVKNLDGDIKTVRTHAQFDPAKQAVTPTLVNGRLILQRNGVDVTNSLKGSVLTANVIKSPKDLFDASTVSGQVRGTDAQYLGVQLSPSEYPSSKSSGERRSLRYIRVFSEDLVQIVQYEANVLNPRFGHPVMYRITFNDPREQHSGVGLPLATVWVHWSRVVHLSDDYGQTVASEIFAPPRMRPCLNPILDVRKIRGAGAEGYWQACIAGIAIETNPTWDGQAIDKEGMRDQLENYVNGLQRFMSFIGFSAKTLAPTVVDPTPHVNVQIQAICIVLGCPQRIFMGSERGELASSQDDSQWNDRIRGRQNSHLTPKLVVRFIDRLIALGVLREPKEGYRVRWPDLDSQTDLQKAQIAQAKITALQAYVAGQVETLLSPMDLWTKFFGLEEEQAQAIVDQATKLHDKEDTMTMPPLGQPGHPATVTPPPKPPTPGPTILGPGQTAIPHPDAGGGKPFTAPGKPTPGVQVAAAPVAPPPSNSSTTGKPKPPVANLDWKDNYYDYLIANYNPDQPRDDQGRFSNGGGIDLSPAIDVLGKALTGGASHEHGEHGHPVDPHHPPGAHFGHTGHISEEVGHYLLHSHSLHAAGSMLSGAGSVVAGLKLFGGSTGAKAAHIEHVVKDWISDRCEHAVSKLPHPIQAAVRGAWAMVRLGTHAAFISYTAGQKFAETVAKERGFSADQARTLRGSLATADVFFAKPTAIFAGPAASFLPMATLGYLSYSTARNPVATARAAMKVVKATVERTQAAKGKALSLIGNEAQVGSWEAITNALQEHKFSDWYVAVLSAAMDHSKSATEAVALANEAFKAQPYDNGNHSDRSVTWLLDLTNPTNNSNPNRDELGRFSSEANAASDRTNKYPRAGFHPGDRSELKAMTEKQHLEAAKAHREASLLHSKAAKKLIALDVSKPLEREVIDRIQTHESSSEAHKKEMKEHLEKAFWKQEKVLDKREYLKKMTKNQFCPTGPGGGVDPSCAPHPGGGKIEGIKGVGSQADPYRCGSNIKLAAELLAKGHHIRLKQPEQVATLLDKMHKMVWEAVEKGETAPKFDLCNVSAKGTNLFCQESLGIPRVKMPQMKGVAEKGSKAEKLGVDKKGEVDLSQQFIDHLKSKGIKTEETTVRASHLRASQNEIVGSKIAKMVLEAQAGKRDLRDKPIFVTRDNYVVDGHHHWAADVGLGYAKGKDLKVPVHRLDCDIGQALDLANSFTREMGIRPKSASATANEAVTNARSVEDYLAAIESMVVNESPEDAVARHEDNPWFAELLQVALEAIPDNPSEAIRLAEEYFEANPDGGDDEDDEDFDIEDLYGDDDDEEDRVENTFCPTGPGGGVDASCSPQDAKADHYAAQMREKFGDGAAAKLDEMKAKVASDLDKVKFIESVKAKLTPKEEPKPEPKVEKSVPAYRNSTPKTVEEATKMLKEADDDSINHKGNGGDYTREVASSVIEKLSGFSKSDLYKVMKEVDYPVYKNFTKGAMLDKIEMYLTAGLRAYERVQA